MASNSNESDSTEGFTLGEAISSIFGALIIFFLGFGTAASTLQSVAWRLNIQRNYEESQCRITKAAVIKSVEDGPYAVDVEHQLEVNGTVYPPTTWTEEERPHAPTQQEAEAMLARYPVGEHCPCWYNKANPEHNSVLLRDGLRPWEPLGYLWRSVALSIPGLLLCLIPYYRVCARRKSRNGATEP